MVMPGGGEKSQGSSGEEEGQGQWELSHWATSKL